MRGLFICFELYYEMIKNYATFFPVPFGDKINKSLNQPRSGLGLPTKPFSLNLSNLKRDFYMS